MKQKARQKIKMWAYKGDLTYGHFMVHKTQDEYGQMIPIEISYSLSAKNKKK